MQPCMNLHMVCSIWNTSLITAYFKRALLELYTARTSCKKFNLPSMINISITSMDQMDCQNQEQPSLTCIYPSGRLTQLKKSKLPSIAYYTAFLVIIATIIVKHARQTTCNLDVRVTSSDANLCPLS